MLYFQKFLSLTNNPDNKSKRFVKLKFINFRKTKFHFYHQNPLIKFASGCRYAF